MQTAEIKERFVFLGVKHWQHGLKCFSMHYEDLCHSNAVQPMSLSDWNIFL